MSKSWYDRLKDECCADRLAEDTSAIAEIERAAKQLFNEREYDIYQLGRKVGRLDSKLQDTKDTLVGMIYDGFSDLITQMQELDAKLDALSEELATFKVSDDDHFNLE